MNDRFQYLSIKYIDGNLSSVESDELVALVKGNKDLQKELAEMLVQDAAIQNVLGAQSQMENEIKVSGAIRPNKTTPKHNSRRFQATKKQSPWPMVAVAAVMFIGLAIPMYLYKKGVIDEQNKGSKQNEIGRNSISQAEVIDVVGRVYRTQNGKKEKLAMRTAIKAGDLIESESGGFAKFQTTAKSLIVLNQNSKFEWNEKQLDLKIGELYAEINKKDIPSVYQLTSPDNAKIAIKGTAFEWCFSDRLNSAILRVKEGTVEFQNGINSKLVTQNQMINNKDFARGVQTIKVEEIAPWLKLIELFRNGDLLFFDDFKGEQFNSFWTVKTNQKDTHLSSPKKGLICEGKNQKIELISQEFSMDGVVPLAIYFESNSVVASNSFEYGYEVWSQEKMVANQGYIITQVNSIKFHIKEIRNFGDSKKLLDEIKTQEGTILKNGELSLPDITFSINLTAKAKDIIEKTEYKKDNSQHFVQLSDVYIQSEGTKFKVIFYLKTINEPSKAQWSFRGFVVGHNDQITNDKFKKITTK